MSWIHQNYFLVGLYILLVSSKEVLESSPRSAAVYVVVVVVVVVVYFIDNLRDLYMIQMSFHIISELCISNNYCAIIMYNTIYILSTRMLVSTVA